jgi:hypothetical protein
VLCVTCLAVLAQKVEPGGSETCVTSSMTCLQSLGGGELETVKKLKNKMKGVDLTRCVVRLAFCRRCLTVYVVSRGLHGAFSPFEGGVSTVCWQSRCLDFFLAKIGRCG